MRTHRLAFATALLAATAAAQDGAKEEKVEPVTLVSRAEKLLKQKEVEDAVLVLWQALDLLAALPSNPVHEATAMSARYLLNENDPREAQRRAVFASIGKQQVELAAAYRAKKWLDTAATRLDVADRYDRDTGVKERAALDAARPKPKTAPAAAPKEEPKPAGPKLSPLLQRANTEFVHGDWKEIGDVLQCEAPKGTHLEWVTKTSHADNEIVVEFRAVDPAKDHNASLNVGLGILPGSANYSGYRLQCDYDPGSKEYGLILWGIVGMKFESLGEAWVKGTPSADGFHRLSIQVRGSRLRAQLDNGAPIEIAGPADVRGKVGLLQGVADSETCAVQFRNFRVDPLPADKPTDAEQRARDEVANQNAITKAVTDAKELLAKKQPEAAALLLRDALERVADLPAGVLRDNLAKTIDPMLAQADTLTVRRRKTAQGIATELATLADEYTKAGLARAALELVQRAAAFDPESQAARLAAAQEAVTQWNLAQAKARANDLMPPADDGTVLREWFGKGRMLLTEGLPFVVEGETARTGAIGNISIATWVPPPLATKPPKYSAWVHLPAAGAEGGLMFDVVDSTSFGVVVLRRLPKVMVLAAHRWVSGKWVPLLERTVPMDAWRRDGWHQITVESSATDMTATCGTTKLIVPRSMLAKATGGIGLYAGNNLPTPVSIEFRALVVPK